MVNGTIFDIQRFSIHDGPGIRTTIFFKGCSLHCFWCHNPEGLSLRRQIQFTESKCINCGACVAVCPENAQQIIDGKRIYDRSLCKDCGLCIENCFSDALLQVGKTISVGETMEEILADSIFYQTSGGGVTLSGGEPALQPEYAELILDACQSRGIHTAIETAGNVPWDFLKRLVEKSDLIMMDLKHMDPVKHRAVTGVSNSLILVNAEKIVGMGKPVIFRTPVIPGVNDCIIEIQAIADFIRRLNVQKGNLGNKHELTWELLTFHKLATDKYRSLGLEYRANDLENLKKEQFNELVAVAQDSGIPIKYSF